jgi:hypothetical protein
MSTLSKIGFFALVVVSLSIAIEMIIRVIEIIF